MEQREDKVYGRVSQFYVLNGIHLGLEKCNKTRSISLNCQFLVEVVFMSMYTLVVHFSLNTVRLTMQLARY